MRVAAAILATALLAAACAEDDPVDDAGQPRTTVPTVTEAPTTTAARAADDSEPADTEDTTEAASSSSMTTSTTTTEPPLPAGDPTAASVSLELVVELDQPIDAVVAPNGEWWIAERPGRIVVVDPDTGEVGDTVVDIDDETRAQGERGLLGLAVDNSSLYVNFTDGAGNTRVDAFVLDETGRPADRVELLTIAQPFSNHNGGALAIGPDGHLYIAVGDGGSGGDPLDGSPAACNQTVGAASIEARLPPASLGKYGWV